MEGNWRDEQGGINQHRKTETGRGGKAHNGAPPPPHWGLARGSATLTGQRQGWLLSSHSAPGQQLQHAQRRPIAETSPGRARLWSTTMRNQPEGGVEGPPRGSLPRRSRGNNSVQKAHQMPQGRRGARNRRGGGGVEDPPKHHHNRDLSPPEWGGGPLYRGRRRPAGLHSCQGTPVVAGSV